MSRFFAWTLAVVLLAACSTKQAPQSTVPKPVPVAQALAPKKPVIQSTKIQTNTADSFLLDYAKRHPEKLVLIKTRHGNMKVKLYDDTPKHRANFLMLASEGYYNQTVFYRVVPELVIQGGDSDNPSQSRWKRQIGQYTIGQEIKPYHIHKKAALAMSRYYEDNPQKRSSSWDFYIVQGRMLNSAEMKKIPEAYRNVYQQLGGAPHLDGEHTVFGEVISGMDVIDKIAAERTDRGDWPINDVAIKIEILE